MNTTEKFTILERTNNFMKTIKIILNEPDLEKDLTIETSLRTINETSIKGLMKKHTKQISRWLLFGNATVKIVQDDGKEIATGKYDCNVFSGVSQYNLTFK